MSGQQKKKIGVAQTLREMLATQKGWKKAGVQLLMPLACYLDKLLSWSRLNAFLASMDDQVSFQEMMTAAGRHFEINIDNADALLKHIPKEGPLVIVANHPTGLLETIMLPALIMRRRSDLRVLANEMLGNLQGMSEGLIPINVFKREEIKRVYTTCTDWLEAGGVLLIFPSGEVADYKEKYGRVRDGVWSRLPVTLSVKTGAPILNVNVAAKSTRLFGLLSRFLKPARVIFLMRELHKHSRQSYACFVAKSLKGSAFSGLSKAKTTSYMQAMNECLPLAGIANEQTHVVEEFKEMKPVEAHSISDAIRQEMEVLMREESLYTSRKIQVYAAKGSEIPFLLRYIQAARELVFREVAMGTGETIDADVHDEAAYHVIVWDTEKQQLVASSRCQVMSSSTPASYLDDMYGINSEQLFQLGDLCAVSRTFVASAYQKSFSSLLCLWRGMAQHILHFETVRFIAGVVSIASFKMPAQLFDYLSKYVDISAAKHPVLAPIFSPKEPYQLKGPIPPEVQSCLETIETVAQLENFFSEISGDTCQFPVLFRQYESLGTVPLAMTVDPDFSGCVDVLQVWDTHELSEKARLFFRDKGIETLRTRAQLRSESLQ